MTPTWAVTIGIASLTSARRSRDVGTKLRIMGRATYHAPVAGGSAASTQCPPPRIPDLVPTRDLATGTPVGRPVPRRRSLRGSALGAALFAALAGPAGVAPAVSEPA